MGTATYCICEEPNCLFVQDPFFGKLFSLKEKKNYSIGEQWEEEWLLHQGRAGDLFLCHPLPCWQGPRSQHFWTTVNNLHKGGAGMTDELKTTYIGY